MRKIVVHRRVSEVPSERRGHEARPQRSSGLGDRKPQLQSARREAQQGVGMRIRAMRRSKGWSQAVFAEMCGIDLTLLGVIERGNQNLGLRALLPIAATLNTTVADLFAGVA